MCFTGFFCISRTLITPLLWVIVYLAFCAAVWALVLLVSNCSSPNIPIVSRNSRISVTHFSAKSLTLTLSWDSLRIWWQNVLSSTFPLFLWSSQFGFADHHNSKIRVHKFGCSNFLFDWRVSNSNSHANLASASTCQNGRFQKYARLPRLARFAKGKFGECYAKLANLLSLANLTSVGKLTYSPDSPTFAKHFCETR
jgi:hypothetical protein